MKIAVMQPYLFPYLGYYQLCNSVDKFVFYDDVNYIKQGYINRNNILSKGGALRFTLSVPNASSNKKIKDLQFSADVRKILETIKQSYCKAPYFSDVYPFIEEVLSQKDRSISSVCRASIESIFNYLGISKQMYLASELEYDREASAADRLVEITTNFGGKTYVNSPGGMALYEKEYFHSKGIELSFIKMRNVIYKQNSQEYVPNLSMIDVVMWNSKIEVIEYLSKYDFI